MKFPWKNVALFLLTLAVLVACLFMLRAFLPAIVGAVVLAVVTRTPFCWLRARLRNVAFAATVALSVVTVGIVIPGLFLVRILGRYAVVIGTMLRDGTLEKTFQGVMHHYPQLAAIAQQGSGFTSWTKVSESAGSLLATHAVAFLSNSVTGIAQIIIMLFLLFFLYRDGEMALGALYSLLPMEQAEARELVVRMEDTVRATFLGHFLVAAIQGVVAGIVFAVLGVTEAAVLGVLTGIVAIIPSFGAYIVWLPVAVYLGLSGHWIKAMVLVVVGTLVISTLDNILYPIMVGAQLRQHTAVIFLALLGGIWLFGVPGLILGPVLFSMATTMLQIWHERNHLGASHT